MLNSLLCSILCRATPDEVKLLLEIARLLSQRLRMTSGILVDYLES